MRDNRSMPANSIIPVLSYPDVRQAVEWLCRVFGFTERLRIAEHRSQLEFGDGTVIITGSSAGAEGAEGLTHSMMVRVANVDSHFAHVQDSGAVVVSTPASFPFGERQYTVRDIAGHVWTFSETVENVEPRKWGGELLRNEGTRK